MSNAKRAIMVPVMTLAVCAIAMVGLGFALTTSVTTESNTVEKLMIDLNENGETLASHNQIDNTSVNGLFTIKMSTDKSTTASNQTKVKYTLDGSSDLTTFVKAMGNVSGDATLTIAFNGDTVPVTIKVTDMGTNGKTEGSSNNMTLGGTSGTNTATITIGNVYKVEIVDVFGATTSAPKEVTYNSGIEVPSFPDSIALTFTANQ